MRTFARLAVAPAAAGALFAAADASALGSFVQPTTVLHAFTGPTRGKGAYFGWAVSPLGDVDRDGRRDILIGEVDGGRHLNGRVWVYSGATGRLLHRFTGRANDQNGYAVADAGDVNGDGVAEIVSGAPGPQTASAPAGAAYVRSGRTGRLLRRLHGFAPGDQFGAAVSSAGDVNRDGRADLLIGAPGSGAPGSQAGRAYVVSGRTFKVIRRLSAHRRGDSFGTATSWTRDVDGDHVPDLIVGAGTAGASRGGAAYAFSGRTGRRLYRIGPPRGAKHFGVFFVAGVGDTNGDRVPDVYVADYGARSGAGFAGVYSGRNGHRLHGWFGRPGDGLGPGREAGDVDRDGRVDLIVGSYTNSDGAEQAGRVQIRSGRTGRLLRTITSRTTMENLGFDAVGLGDVDGDGRPDELVSAANRDTVYVISGARPG
jgi:hypothetical protein